jgi:DnaJ like chaperone protein
MFDDVNIDFQIKEKYLRIILAIAAFIFGSLLIGNVFAGIILAIAFMYIRYVVLFKQSSGGMFKKKGLYNQADFVRTILLLSAAIIKVDKRIYQKEKDLVKLRLEYDFNKREVEKYMRDLELCLDKKILVTQLCNNIKHNLDTPTKLQLLNFLTGLTVSNGLMIDAEYHLLAKIARLLMIPGKSFKSILALFNFKRIRTYENPNAKSKSGSKSRSKSKNRSDSKTRTSPTKLATAFIVLELKETATADEIKSAYRKLAKIHHPDRVVHLGGQFQKNAKVKFQKIAEAYEIIKEKKGFK